MLARLLGRQAHRREPQLAADGFRDVSERHPRIGDRVQSGTGRCGFHGEPVQGRRGEPQRGERMGGRRDGRPAPDGPLVGAHADKLEAVASGRALALAPADGTNRTLRHDLTAIAVRGIEPCTVVMVTRARERGHLITAFRESARSHLRVS